MEDSTDFGGLGKQESGLAPSRKSRSQDGWVTVMTTGSPEWLPEVTGRSPISTVTGPHPWASRCLTANMASHCVPPSKPCQKAHIVGSLSVCVRDWHLSLPGICLSMENSEGQGWQREFINSVRHSFLPPIQSPHGDESPAHRKYVTQRLGYNNTPLWKFQN